MSHGITPILSASDGGAGNSTGRNINGGAYASVSAGAAYCIKNCPETGKLLQRAVDPNALHVMVQADGTYLGVKNDPSPSHVALRLGLGNFVVNGYVKGGVTLDAAKPVVGIGGDIGVIHIFCAALNMAIPAWVPTLHAELNFARVRHDGVWKPGEESVGPIPGIQPAKFVPGLEDTHPYGYIGAAVNLIGVAEALTK